MPKPPQTTRVPVTGGELAVHRLTEPTGRVPVVVAVHGITANGLSFGPVAERLAGRALVHAPDLRGRGASRDLAEPRGLSAHADDVLAVVEATGAGQVVLAGHSMGAYVAAMAAARAPHRVSRLLLIDGGLTLPLPEQAAALPPEQLVQAVIGPAMARLSMTFDSPEHYEQFWARHPALGPALDGPSGDLIRAYLRHDLVPGPEGRGWVSSCRVEHVKVDGVEVLLDAEAAAAPRSVVAAGVPTSLLWAGRGLMNEDGGLYTQERLDALHLPDGLATEFVPGANHYSMIFEPTAALVADRILGA